MSLPEHLSLTLMLRVDVGMQVARALPPPLQPTQQSPPSFPGGPGCRYCTKVSKSLLFYALFYLRGWDPRWEPPTIKSVNVWRGGLPFVWCWGQVGASVPLRPTHPEPGEARGHRSELEVNWGGLSRLSINDLFQVRTQMAPYR